ncbi:hypothetical protein BGW39_002399 [Mortierella sp. 14UC]|nr:hypothetical protein BGW39_002399 [Mortierella sp. 14UC]
METQNTEGARWVRMGAPTCNIDRESRTAIAASMITRPKPVHSKSIGGGPRPHDHEILLYDRSDLTYPIACCGNEIWEKDRNEGPQPMPWHHPFPRDAMQVVQVVEIKHYRETIVMGEMLVVIVVAFGQRTSPPVNNATDTRWLMVKVIEVWVPAYPWTVFNTSMMDHFHAEPSVDDMTVKNCVRINPDDVVNYESLEPRQNQITVHGRIIKLYSACEELTATGGQQPECMDVDTRGNVNCIGIFGALNSDTVSAIVIGKGLLRDEEKNTDLGKKTYSNKAEQDKDTEHWQ